MDTTHGAPVIVLTVAYDGARFSGFARQINAVTVQERLEASLATVLRREVRTVCAGRTDAGVHALGQVVSISSEGQLPAPEILLRALNALTPGVVVREVRFARSGFSARFDAVRREYRYRLHSGQVPPLFSADVAWWIKKDLDLEAMRAGAALLVGEHDFRSFCVTTSAAGKRTVRRVESIEIIEEPILGEPCLTVRIIGNAFLHSMVRTIVGSLAEVGVGRYEPDWIGEALAAKKRVAAGQTAPACGLTLWSVEYPDDVWLDAGDGARSASRRRRRGV